MSLQSTRSTLVGAIIGATALAGTIVGVSTIAGAQEDTDPVLDPDMAELDEDFFPGIDDDFAEFEACLDEQLGDIDEQAFIDAETTCDQFLPEEVLADIEAWRPYEECVDGEIGEIDDPWIDGDEPSDADWEAFDAAWETADAACRDLLPADAQADMEAWDAFDECLSDSGVFDDQFIEGTMVHVETLDGFQTVEFGDTEGSVTITGTADGVTMTSTGGVTVIDEAALDAEWEAFDAAHEACEQLLPEG